MAWERRGARHYYYRSRREGLRVVKEYVGQGPLAQLAAKADAVDRRERLAERRALSEDRTRLAAADAGAEVIYDAAEAALCRALTSAGFHRHHRGEWRRRR